VFGLALLAGLVMAFNLAAFIGAKATLQFGLFAGLATGLGWVAMSLGVIYLFEQRPFKLWLINSGYQVITYTVMGGILGAWPARTRAPVPGRGRSDPYTPAPGRRRRRAWRGRRRRSSRRRRR
jgi:Zn-dependent protease with chaperone function